MLKYDALTEQAKKRGREAVALYEKASAHEQVANVFTVKADERMGAANALREQADAQRLEAIDFYERASAQKPGEADDFVVKVLAQYALYEEAHAQKPEAADSVAKVLAQLSNA